MWPQLRVSDTERVAICCILINKFWFLYESLTSLPHKRKKSKKKLDVTRRRSVDGYVSICCDLDLWSFDLISMSQAQVHTWPNCGKITSNSYRDIVFTRFYGDCLLWLWPLSFWCQNTISISMNANTHVTKIWRNSLHCVLRYGVHKVFGTHRLTHSRTDRPEYSMPPAPFFNSGRGIKRKTTKRD